MKNCSWKMSYQNYFLAHDKATWPVNYPSKRHVCISSHENIEQGNLFPWEDSKFRYLEVRTIQMGKPLLSKILRPSTQNWLKAILLRVGKPTYLSIEELTRCKPTHKSETLKRMVGKPTYLNIEELTRCKPTPKSETLKQKEIVPLERFQD